MSAITNGGYQWETEAPEHWTELAACAQVPPDVMFPEPGESPRNAKAVCSSCAVVAPCLQAALENDEQHGVWGNMTRLERRRLKNPNVHRREHLRSVGRMPWTAEDDRILHEMYAAGETDMAIGERLGRHSSVIGRRRRSKGMRPLFKRGGNPA